MLQGFNRLRGGKVFAQSLSGMDVARMLINFSKGLQTISASDHLSEGSEAYTSRCTPNPTIPETHTLSEKGPGVLYEVPPGNHAGESRKQHLNP